MLETSKQNSLKEIVASLKDTKSLIKYLQSDDGGKTEPFYLAEAFIKKPKESPNLQELEKIFEIFPIGKADDKETDKNKRHRFNLFWSWIARPQNNCTAENLEEIYKIIPNHDLSGNAIDDQLKKELMLGLFRYWIAKQSNDCDFKKLSENLYLSYGQKNVNPEFWKQKIAIFESWIGKTATENVCDHDNFKKILSEIPADKESNKTKIILFRLWIRRTKANCDLEYLKEVLSLPVEETISDQFSRYRLEILTSWLEKEDNDCSFEELKKALFPEENQQDEKEDIKLQKIKIFGTWIAKTKNLFEQKDFENILSKVADDEAGVKIKTSLFQTWIIKANGKCDFRYLAEILSLPIYGGPNGKENYNKYRLDILSFWLGKEGNDCSFEELNQILLLNYKKIAESESKESLNQRVNCFSIWAKKTKNVCSLDDFSKVLSIIPDAEKNKEPRTNLFLSWAGKKEKYDFDELKEALKLYSLPDQKLRLVKNWITRNRQEPHKLPFADLKLLLENFPTPVEGYESKPEQHRIAMNWIINNRNNELSDLNFDDFKWLLQQTNLDEYKKITLKAWWKKHDNIEAEDKYQNFVKLVKGGLVLNRFDTREIAKIYNDLGLPKDKFANLCKDLHPNNESAQLEIFKEFVNKIYKDFLSRVTGDALSLNRIGFLRDKNRGEIKQFIINLTDDEFAIEALKAVRKKAYFSPSEILDISGGRLSLKYQSIKEVLNKPLENSLTKAGLKTVKTLFGKQITDDLNLAKLFSYYDIKQNLAGFRNLINPEVLDEISDNFSPSDKSAWISAEETKKLTSLMGRRKLQLSSTVLLTSYLESVVPKIPELTREKIDSWKFFESQAFINAAEFQFHKKLAKTGETQLNESQKAQLIEEEKTKLTEEFKTLLKNQDPGEREVATFFRKILSLESEINSRQWKKLQDFFKANKPSLAALFESENGLLEFSLKIDSLGDGCIANIASNAKSALNRALITDPCGAVLLNVFDEKISTPILNSGGDHLTSSATGIDVFNLRSINASFISPRAFLNALIEQILYTAKDEKEKQSEYIIKKLDEKGGEEICTRVRSGELEIAYQELEDAEKKLPNQTREKLNKLELDILEKHKKPIDEKLAKIAAYLVLKEALPDIFKSRYLEEFRKDCETLTQPNKDKQGVGNSKQAKMELKNTLTTVITTNENPNAKPRNRRGRATTVIALDNSSPPILNSRF